MSDAQVVFTSLVLAAKGGLIPAEVSNSFQLELHCTGIFGRAAWRAKFGRPIRGCCLPELHGVQCTGEAARSLKAQGSISSRQPKRWRTQLRPSCLRTFRPRSECSLCWRRVVQSESLRWHPAVKAEVHEVRRMLRAPGLCLTASSCAKMHRVSWLEATGASVSTVA